MVVNRRTFKLKYPHLDKKTGHVICQICGKRFLRITNPHLLKEHKMTLEQYRNKFPFVPTEASLIKPKDVILPYPPYNKETGKVICQICGKEFLVISSTHIKNHNLSYKDYVNRYPNALLSSKEFTLKTRYGVNKNIFEPPPDDKFKEIIVNEEPDIEDEIDIESILKDASYVDPVKQSKSQVLDTLKSYFTNIRSDYMIECYGPVSKRLKYQFITDFTDPILKVVVQFPQTFWHNNDTNIDMMKNDKLTTDGWKVIIIKGKAPSRKDIQKVLEVV